MRPYALALAASLLLAPAASFAHGTLPAAAHGGVIAESSGEHWVELVVRGDQVTAVLQLTVDSKPVTVRFPMG